MPTTEVSYRLDPFPDAATFGALWLAAWGSAPGSDLAAILKRSLVHVGAYADGELVGYVNVAWDGGEHAFLLDTTVHPRLRRRGIATELVRHAAEAARLRGAGWLHVDHEPQLTGFYRGCGFRPTTAGLIRLAG